MHWKCDGKSLNACVNSLAANIIVDFFRKRPHQWKTYIRKRLSRPVGRIHRSYNLTHNLHINLSPIFELLLSAFFLLRATFITLFSYPFVASCSTCHKRSSQLIACTLAWSLKWHGGLHVARDRCDEWVKCISFMELLSNYLSRVVHEGIHSIKMDCFNRMVYFAHITPNYMMHFLCNLLFPSCISPLHAAFYAQSKLRQRQREIFHF